eukprot:m.19377 g.19377  ORF g.19377 m.19377 type:complete len:1072 (+) comp10355_c0_seq2:122-3337(+)
MFPMSAPTRTENVEMVSGFSGSLASSASGEDEDSLEEPAAAADATAAADAAAKKTEQLQTQLDSLGSDYAELLQKHQSLVSKHARLVQELATEKQCASARLNYQFDGAKDSRDYEGGRGGSGGAVNIAYYFKGYDGAKDATLLLQQQVYPPATFSPALKACFDQDKMQQELQQVANTIAAASGSQPVQLVFESAVCTHPPPRASELNSALSLAGLIHRLLASLTVDGTHLESPQLKDVLNKLHLADDLNACALLGKISTLFHMDHQVSRSPVIFIGYESAGKSVLCNALLGLNVSYSDPGRATRCIVEYLCTVDCDATSLSFTIKFPSTPSLNHRALTESISEAFADKCIILAADTVKLTSTEAAKDTIAKVMIALKEKKAMVAETLQVAINGPSSLLSFAGIAYDTPGIPRSNEAVSIDDTASVEEQRCAINGSIKILGSVLQDPQITPLVIALDRLCTGSVDSESRLSETIKKAFRDRNQRASEDAMLSLMAARKWINVYTHADQFMRKDDPNGKNAKTAVKVALRDHHVQVTYFLDLHGLFEEDNYLTAEQVRQQILNNQKNILESVKASAGSAEKLDDQGRVSENSFDFKNLEERWITFMRSQLPAACKEAAAGLQDLHRWLHRPRNANIPNPGTVRTIVESFVRQWLLLCKGVFNQRTPTDFIFDEEINRFHAEFPGGLSFPWRTDTSMFNGQSLQAVLTSLCKLKISLHARGQLDAAKKEFYTQADEKDLPFSLAYAKVCNFILLRCMAVALHDIHFEEMLRMARGADTRYNEAEFEIAISRFTRGVIRCMYTQIISYAQAILETFMRRAIDMTLLQMYSETTRNAREPMQQRLTFFKYHEPMSVLRRQLHLAALSLLDEQFTNLRDRLDQNDDGNATGFVKTFADHIGKIPPEGLDSSEEAVLQVVGELVSLSNQGDDANILPNTTIGSHKHDAALVVKIAQKQLLIANAMQADRLFHFLTSELQPMLFDTDHESIFVSRARNFTLNQVLWFSHLNVDTNREDTSTQRMSTSSAFACQPEVFDDVLRSAYMLDQLEESVSEEKQRFAQQMVQQALEAINAKVFQ